MGEKSDGKGGGSFQPDAYCRTPLLDVLTSLFCVGSWVRVFIFFVEWSGVADCVEGCHPAGRRISLEVVR